MQTSQRYHFVNVLTWKFQNSKVSVEESLFSDNYVLYLISEMSVCSLCETLLYCFCIKVFAEHGKQMVFCDDEWQRHKHVIGCLIFIQFYKFKELPEWIGRVRDVCL